MRTHFCGLGYPAAVALLVVILAAGCGGGGSDSGSSSGAGISATASLTGNTVSVSAHTDRSDIALVWASITGAADQVTLNGSGKDWSGSAQVIAQANSVITINVFARDSLGNQLGPATVLVTMGQFGAQPTVTGVVVSRDTGAAVVGATVTIGSQSTATTATGRFILTGLSAGMTVEGVVTKSGFAEARFTVTLGTQTVDAGRISLAPTQDLPPPVPSFP